jgi:hypothetical protein
MKTLCMILASSLVALGAPASGQTSIPKKPDSSVKTPSEPGMRSTPESSMKAPSNPGMVVVPPKTGTEEMVTKPRNVDPEMNSATEGIDKKNREKSEEKAK